MPAEKLAATVIRAVVARSGIDPERIEDVVMAQSYANSEAPCIGRWATLDAGLPVAVPGLQIDRRCGCRCGTRPGRPATPTTRPWRVRLTPA